MIKIALILYVKHDVREHVGLTLDLLLALFVHELHQVGDCTLQHLLEGVAYFWGFLLLRLDERIRNCRAGRLVSTLCVATAFCKGATVLKIQVLYLDFFLIITIAVWCYK